ncbi:hypothetical protein BLNAU_3802 [Blattamonas nauphoetae]|uniref:C2 domain-containing protein n=1 Tax=Blattamonas nauphoetae TaxID=2049346 RepID=A0ABQ9YCG2_9EUKA|nr:hypothetical protein BLNAU_3802 [Blattamonas nauphoetae]
MSSEDIPPQSTDQNDPPIPNSSEKPIAEEDNPDGTDANVEYQPEHIPVQYMFRLCDIQMYNVKSFDSTASDPYLTFTLGGNFKIVDMRHANGKLEAKGRKGPTFRTKTVKHVSPKSRAVFPDAWTTYWKGSEEDLKQQDLVINCYDWNCIRRNQWMGSARINLFDLATGSVTRSQIHLYEKKGKRHVANATLDFVAYFQEVHMFELNCHDWQCFNLIPPTPDAEISPFVSVKFMGLPTLKVKTVRRVVSEFQPTTTFPEFEDIGILQFAGIRSDFENEDLKIKVKDYDSLNKTLIGYTYLPLRGLLDIGFYECQLSTKDAVTGRINGYIDVVSVPNLHQTNDKIVLKPLYRYLCAHITSCIDLVAKDDQGYSSPFVTVEWDGAKLSTRVIKNDLCPTFNETLFFPIKLPDTAIKRSYIQQKGDVKFSVYAYSADGNDILGSTSISLYQITHAGLAPDPYRGGRKTRMFKANEGLPLLIGGEKTEKNSIIICSVHISPDFPDEVIIPPQQPKRKHLIPQSYLDHMLDWKSHLPVWLSRNSPYEIAATNSEDNDYLLSCFLTPNIPIPKGLRHPRLLMRMVYNMMWATDDKLFDGTAMQKKRIFLSPLHALQIRKGDDQDHSVLLCSLFLSMGIDAYLCMGTTKQGKRHVFVMTREFDGCVIFWETSRGTAHICPMRWTGVEGCPPDYILFRNELLGLRIPVRGSIAAWRKWKESQFQRQLMKKKADKKKKREEWERKQAEKRGEEVNPLAEQANDDSSGQEMDELDEGEMEEIELDENDILELDREKKRIEAEIRREKEKEQAALERKKKYEEKQMADIDKQKFIIDDDSDEGMSLNVSEPDVKESAVEETEWKDEKRVETASLMTLQTKTTPDNATILTKETTDNKTLHSKHASNKSVPTRSQTPTEPAVVPSAQPESDKPIPVANKPKKKRRMTNLKFTDDEEAAQIGHFTSAIDSVLGMGVGSNHQASSQSKYSVMLTAQDLEMSQLKNAERTKPVVEAVPLPNTENPPPSEDGEDDGKVNRDFAKPVHSELEQINLSSSLDQSGSFEGSKRDNADDFVFDLPSEFDMAEEKVVLEQETQNLLMAQQAAATGIDAINTVPVFESHLPEVFLPYSSLDVIVNHKNIWANAQHLDPALISYDLENLEQWIPFFGLKKKKVDKESEQETTSKGGKRKAKAVEPPPEEKDEEEEAKGFQPVREYPIEPFFETGTEKVRIPPAMSMSKAEQLEKIIYDEIKIGYVNYRNFNHIPIQFDRPIEPVLRNGLMALEYEEVTGIPNPRGIAAWHADISLKVSDGFHFVGVPIHFCYTEPKRIRKYIMATFDFHKTESKSVKYSFAVYISPQVGGISSVWTYVAMICPADEQITKKDQLSSNKVIANITGMKQIKRKW